MAVVKRTRASGVVYYVVTWAGGAQHWERAGTDRREAGRLDSRRKAEVAAGTFTPPKRRRYDVVRDWLAAWLDERATRTADNDRALIERHVYRRAFADLRVADVRPRHVIELVGELKATVSEATKRKLSAKTVAIIYGILRTAFRDAQIRELTHVDPFVVPRGTISRKASKRRLPYSAAELITLTTDERIDPDRRMWNALAFYTGMREGEVCGRRWRDWVRDSAPLGCLVVETQYDDQPLKTDDESESHPRRVPVHPTLAAMLDAWWRDGFEFAFLRRPTIDDFIVPRRDTMQNLTGSMAYKAFRASLDRVQIDNRTAHSTRHTFVTLARRGGARKDVLERVTHNATGEVIDQYTHYDWAPLCEAVACFRPHVDRDVDARTIDPRKQAPAAGLEPASGSGSTADPRGSRAIPTPGDPHDPSRSGAVAADSAARQRPEVAGAHALEWDLYDALDRAVAEGDL